MSTVRMVEEGMVQNSRMGNVVDALGADWEYVKNPNDVLLYHGFKEESDTLSTLNYLLSI